ncbi:glycoside hydrolase family 3 C-terminal domain-containing protein [Galbitalea sp. SE-J8]|uniref:beta-glucosidase family protein n=1 Tax=Galbitalea sp. SE-J8 TaxID=3054952 RepID=UPI00259CABDC|nr:glycoside hydrolase family 3 C-terminal domain-containing protein [Galbitalea sp. SE-J8]MDM4762844.1 glycoside hydrolase family 3 C-terminal domain-containing protein [Galbitalea sp. SE-J8]
MTIQSAPAGLGASGREALDGYRDLARSLPIEDRVRLLTGRTMWELHALPQLGLRAIVVSDGPVGVRGTGEDADETSALFPTPSAIAATWDRRLAIETGRAFAHEARSHGVDVVLAPQLNLQRTPVGGRHFECYSEDPFLTGEIGTGVVEGLQRSGVAACVKHFIANDSETDRTSYISEVDARTLREVYLAPFERAIGVGAWSFMAAYNRVDDGVETGTMTAHRHLLVDLLKHELGFDGVVVSDWAATRLTEESALGGLDLVMPGPRGPWGDRLLDAVRAGRVPEGEIDDKVARILLLASRVGALGAAPLPLEPAGAARDLIRSLAARATVVLRRDERDPVWDRPAPARIALIGANAVRPHVLGGGSSTVHPAHVVTPAEGLAARWPDAELTVHRGGDTRALAPLLDLAGRSTGRPAVRVRRLDAAGRELGVDELADWDGWLRDLPDEVDAVELEFVARLHEPGDHTLAVGTVAGHRVEIDGRVVAEDDGRAGVEVVLDSSVNNPAGVPVVVHVDEPRDVVIRSAHRVTRAGGYGNLVRAAVRHAVPGPGAEREIADAVAAARAADLVVVVVGTNEESESEGWDRETLALPGRQDELVERVLDAVPDAVIVVNAGAPVLLPWLDRARTVLWAWFPGQEAGHALADVLAGAVEASGRLPWTLPARAEDVPVPDAVPVDGRVVYRDGVHVGYRAYERDAIEPAAAFGAGLGWTDWRYDAVLGVETHDGGGHGGGHGGGVVVEGDVDVDVLVTNTGQRDGREVVQLYLEAPHPVPGDLDRPARWLGGFAVVDVAAGESRRVTVRVARRRFEVWDPRLDDWALPAGSYGIRLGRSVRDLRLGTAVRLGLDAVEEG